MLATIGVQLAALFLNHALDLAAGNEDGSHLHAELVRRLNARPAFQGQEAERVPGAWLDAQADTGHCFLEEFALALLIELPGQVVAGLDAMQAVENVGVAATQADAPASLNEIAPGVLRQGPKPAAKTACRIIGEGP